MLNFLDCVSLDFLNMTYKPRETKEILWEIMTQEVSDNQENLLTRLLAQDFDFNYKFFGWLFIKYDLIILCTQISQHISTLFKEIQR